MQLFSSSFSQEKNTDFVEVRSNKNGYTYISPLLECEANALSTVANMDDLKDELTATNEQRKNSGEISFASVYFKDLSENSWFGINESERFAPASLLKVPVMMTAFKLAEESPELLNTQLVAKANESELVQNVQPPDALQPGENYSVLELIERMVSQSDNDAYFLLFDFISQEKLMEVYRKTDINIEPFGSDRSLTDLITVREYARFFRVLYNSSYLNEESSEKALEILTQSTYKDGLVKYLGSTVVAHKFGERKNTENNQTQLHDCGIVYYPERPYLICIMTKGINIDDQAEVIAELSYQIFESWSNQY